MSDTNLILTIDELVEAALFECIVPLESEQESLSKEAEDKDDELVDLEAEHSEAIKEWVKQDYEEHAKFFTKAFGENVTTIDYEAECFPARLYVAIRSKYCDGDVSFILDPDEDLVKQMPTYKAIEKAEGERDLIFDKDKSVRDSLEKFKAKSKVIKRHLINEKLSQMSVPVSDILESVKAKFLDEEE